MKEQTSHSVHVHLPPSSHPHSCKKWTNEREPFANIQTLAVFMGIIFLLCFITHCKVGVCIRLIKTTTELQYNLLLKRLFKAYGDARRSVGDRAFHEGFL